MKQIDMKKSISFLLVFSLSVFTIFTSGLSYQAEKADPPGKTSIIVRNGPLLADESFSKEKTIKKDESVYVTLKPDGMIDKMSIVNLMQTPAAGEYTDYGAYTSVKSLSLKTEPVIAGNRITWNLPASDKGFYYQGSLENAEPPFKIGLEYFLNDKKSEIADIIGKSGRIRILIKVSANPGIADYFKKNYLCQIQFPVSMSHTANIAAPDAQTVISGTTRTLSYVVLPGKSESFTVEFETSAFETDAMTIISIPFSAGNYLGIDPSTLDEGISRLVEGADSLVSGTAGLKNGMVSLSAALKTIAGSSDKIANGLKSLNSGMKSYQNGIGELSGNLREFSSGSALLAKNSTALQEGFSHLSGGVNEMVTGLQPLLSMLPADQQAAYAQKINTLMAGIAEYELSLDKYMESVSQIALAADRLAGGMETLAAGGSTIESGMNDSFLGFSMLDHGISVLNEKAAALPAQVEKLVQGQSKLSGGIRESAKLLDSFTADTGTPVPVSFADPTVNVDSVQFFMTVPAQSMAAPVVPDDSDKEEKSFLQKLIDLFK